MKEILKNGFSKLSIDYTDDMLEKFELYAKLLVEWNEKMNLTAITEKEEIAVKHFIDCASCLTKVDLSGKVIDVGTGAGFPGMVLKILKPEIKITLLDSLNKRLIFLQEVTDKLNLKDVEIVHYRAEDGGRDKKLRENFDFCVSRAVANLSTLSEYCLPFVKQGGFFISMKGPDVKEELNDAKNAINKLGGEIISAENILLPDTDISHSVISIKKVRQTPTAYPRKAGKPSKEPLK